jgi:hypothetical protein
LASLSCLLSVFFVFLGLRVEVQSEVLLKVFEALGRFYTQKLIGQGYSLGVAKGSKTKDPQKLKGKNDWLWLFDDFCDVQQNFPWIVWATSLV